MRDQGRHWTDGSSNKNTENYMTRQRYYRVHFRSFVYGVYTVQCFAWLNSNHVCVISGTTVAVTKAHRLRNISCCFVMDQERLQGSFSQADVRTIIKLYVLLDKSTLGRCFATGGPRPGTGPWHQLCRTMRGSPGICHFSFLSIFHE
jgi:hypothetical protein